MAKTVALIGNPNCGKTTLFNSLTGHSQTVGNWPGVTIDRKSGDCWFDGQQYEIVDLPGIYSLEQDQLGLDETIAKSYLHNDKPDLIVNIVDASTLNRQLLLTHQLLDMNIPMLIVVNMLDVAKAQQITVNLDALEQLVGVPVVGSIASMKKSTVAVKKALSLASIKQGAMDTLPLDYSDRLLSRLDVIRGWVANSVDVDDSKVSVTEKLDKIILNQWLGVPIFLFMIYCLFTFAINGGAVFIDFFDILLNSWLVVGSRALLSAFYAPEWIIVLLSDGVGGGIQLVGTFIPVIAFLYIGLSILEGSGYLPRAAFVVDRLMRTIGLPGRSFVPLIVGFGCNVPAVMATRSLNNPYDRMITIAMTPFMSCGARLTVYALFAAVLFKSDGQNIVFLLYLIGVLMAVITGWVFRKALSADRLSYSMMDLPAYHLPTLRNISITTWQRLKSFLLDAGKTIVLVVTALSFISSWGTDGSFGNENKENSVLSELGRSFTPVLSPMGVSPDNWPATVGVITGIFAKEAVVGTLDSLYSDIAGVVDEPVNTPGQWQSTVIAVNSISVNFEALFSNLSDPLGIGLTESSSDQESAQQQGVREETFMVMAELFSTKFAAFCYLLFILLYTPCVAVIGAVVRESGAYWAGVVVGWSTILAYTVSTSVYQVGTFGSHPVFSMTWLLASTIALFAAYLILKKIAIFEARRSGLITVVNIN